LSFPSRKYFGLVFARALLSGETAMPAPISLNDNQMRILMANAACVPRGLRSEFLQQVAAQLRGRRFHDREFNDAVLLCVRRVNELGRHREGVIDGTVRAEPAKAKVPDIAAAPPTAP
jgi:hypothetical protein